MKNAEMEKVSDTRRAYKREWYLRNRERLLACWKFKYANDLAFRKKKITITKKYQKKNRERNNKYRREYNKQFKHFSQAYMTAEVYEQARLKVMQDLSGGNVE